MQAAQVPPDVPVPLMVQLMLRSLRVVRVLVEQLTAPGFADPQDTMVEQVRSTVGAASFAPAAGSLSLEP